MILVQSPRVMKFCLLLSIIIVPPLTDTTYALQQLDLLPVLGSVGEMWIGPELPDGDPSSSALWSIGRWETMR